MRGIAIAVLAIAYFAAGKFGLTLAFVNASASAVWPPTGLAIASLLLFGIGLWPAILVGAFAVNVTTSGDIASSVGIAIGNTLEAVIATVLVNRGAGGASAFERPQDVLRFTLFAAVFATAVSATVGVTSLVLRGLAAWTDFSGIWLTWWLGDASGALVLTPALVVWARERPRPTLRRTAEAGLLAIATVTTALFVFGGFTGLSESRYPIAFLSFPVLVWAAFRFGPPGAAASGLTMAALAVWGTLRGVGPYAMGEPNESLVLLQSFMAIAIGTSLTLAAAVLDRERTESRALVAEQRMRQVAEESARVREEFLSVATHELRTPLTSLSGYAQLAQRALEGADERGRLPSTIDSIVRQAARLSGLITNLLDASRVEGGRLAIDPKPTELSVLVANAVDAARLSDPRRHRWDVRIDPEIRAVVDPLRWEQVVANLLDNAVKYSPEGRSISVRLRRDVSGPITLEVADDGIGIPPDRVQRIFERFYRAHQDQGLGGLGLGLYIAREIVARHDGDMAVQSGEHRGTTFTVTLPASRAIGAMPRAAAQRDDMPATPANRRHVLVIDDDESLRELVGSVLRETGYDVTLARNGEEALAAATRVRPDLIMLDKLMPGMDGTAFAKVYREATSDPAPIVAFCAARDAATWAASIGAVAHVTKPFEVEALERTVRAHLRDVEPTAARGRIEGDDTSGGRP